MGSYESDPFASTHIQRKGALIAGILDIYDFMGINDREEWEKYFSEGRGRYNEASFGEGTDECLYYYPDELKAMDDEQIVTIFGALTDLDSVYDNDVGYRVTVIESRLRA